MASDDNAIYRLLSFVERSPNRTTILEVLNSKDVYTPTDLEDETDLNLTNVSRALSELSGKDLVECLNPDSSKFRYYSITSKGSEVADKIDSR